MKPAIISIDHNEKKTSNLLVRWAIVLGGILLGQIVVYGPSLAGKKVLLPLEDLTRPGMYIPGKAPSTLIPSPASDLIMQFEPSRRFAVSEWRTGRMPMWAPFHFAGAPFTWQKFSPFLALESCFASPIVIPWTQVIAAIVAGTGAFLFFRRVLAVSFWSAAICCWCYPLTGFFISWQGFPIGLPVYWLPWILLAVHQTVHQPVSFGPIALALTAALVLISGQLDIAGQVLLVSGLYALWCLFENYRLEWLKPQARRAIRMLVFGWILGFLLASPAVLPTYEYAKTGARMTRRSEGVEERPPVGLSALPQVVLPNMYGLNIRLVDGNAFESSASAYAGVLATLLLAPLAWLSPRHRRTTWFWVFLGFFALSWCLNVPGFVQLLRLPGLNMMSHNRLVFAASFAILALAAIGLEVFSRGPLTMTRWFIAPATLLLLLCVWSGYRAMFLPEPIDTQLPQLILQGQTWIHDLEGGVQLQNWFVRHYTVAAIWCGLGVLGWLMLLSRWPWQARLLPVMGALMLGDMLWFAYGRNAQCDPALYYPQIPVLQQVAQSVPGRVIGYNCLQANLASMCGLHDIRGYDAVDPARFIELIDLAKDPSSGKRRYALTQVLTPKLSITNGVDIQLSPIMDMLNVRYVIFKGTPQSDFRPAFKGEDYFVLINPSALKRVFVPRTVETIPEQKARLNKLASSQFDPREVAFVEEPVKLPASCRGVVEITREIPTHVSIALNMETPGLVVLADLWDKGWRAYLNGKSVPILRTNHAIRGVLVQAGTGQLEFRYEPASFTWGSMMFAASSLAILGWIVILFRKRGSANKKSSSQLTSKREMLATT